jgi:hypothetical protein
MNGYPPPMAPLAPVSVWKAVQTDDGKEYYYNTATSTTTWEKPDELRDDVEVWPNFRFVGHQLTRRSATSMAPAGQSTWPRTRSGTFTTSRPRRPRGAYPTPSSRRSTATSTTSRPSDLPRQAPLAGARALLQSRLPTTTGAPNATSSDLSDTPIAARSVSATANPDSVATGPTSTSQWALSSSSPARRRPRLPS